MVSLLVVSQAVDEGHFQFLSTISPGIADTFFLSLGAGGESSLPYDAVRVEHMVMSKTLSKNQS